MKNILHITPHLGGGVGRVLLSWLGFDRTDSHTIATLDYANDNAVEFCAKNHIEIVSRISVSNLLKRIEPADITVIHFWNHPLLYDFLVRNKLPKSRIIIWSHISGANPPYVFNNKLLDITDKFVFTTPISYKYINNSPKLCCILSTGGVEEFYNIKKAPHDTYNIGYIGTVDYAKMHPDFVETLTKTNADRIFIAGWGNEKEIFKNCDERFNILGKISEVKLLLSELDVFAYMLNPNHYGTGEQVLQEAMAAGVVPVVMDNPCELSLVEHNKTGLVAKNPEEYINYVNILKTDSKLRQALSNNAKEYAKVNFILKKLCSDWQSIFNEVIDMPKTSKEWKLDRRIESSYDIFLESLGEYSKLFENKSREKIANLLKLPEWSSSTKGTPKQYYQFLSGDKLKNLCNLY